jgi:hypothetical protein
MVKRAVRSPLLLRVCAELGAGRITEAYLRDPGLQTSGYADKGHITINPTWETVDTLIHECLHRLYPAWSETYVRNRTAYLRNRLTDAEVQTLYDEYRKRVKIRKTVRKLEASA